MSYKTSSNSLRNTQLSSWDINLLPKNYNKLATNIKVFYFIKNFYMKRNIYLVSYQNLNINFQDYLHIYYSKSINNKSINRFWFLDKSLKFSLEKKLELYFNNLDIVLITFNILNSILKTSLQEFKKVYTDIYRKFKRRKKIKYLKPLIHILNICIYTGNIELLSTFLVNELCKLRKQWTFIYLVSKIINEFFNFYKELIGLKFAIAGRINGRSRKVTYVRTFGSVPAQSINSNIKYSLDSNYNIYGAFSIKVWVHFI